MKRPIFNFPSLGSVHSLGYFVAIFVLMTGGVMMFLHYLLLVTYAVPIFGSVQRQSIVWKVFCIVSVTSAVGFLVYQFSQQGSEGLIFYHGLDEYGFSGPRINLFSFLVVSLILLPLSAACGIDRVIKRRKGSESPLDT